MNASTTTLSPPILILGADVCPLSSKAPLPVGQLLCTGTAGPRTRNDVMGLITESYENTPTGSAPLSISSILFYQPSKVYKEYLVDLLVFLLKVG
jgi:hypothetical protein